MVREAPSEDDFGSVYDEHVWTVYGFFAYRTGSRSDAEDLTQLTFERALRSWGRFDERKGSLTTWLLAIARNLLIDHYRADRSARNQPIDEANPPPEARIDPYSPDTGLSVALAAGIATLTAREREVIALRYGGDLTGAQIAELTELTLANVQQINSRALRKLRDHLEGLEP